MQSRFDVIVMYTKRKLFATSRIWDNTGRTYIFFVRPDSLYVRPLFIWCKIMKERGNFLVKIFYYLYFIIYYKSEHKYG